MKNQERAELLTMIEQLCERYPHWRLGQLVAGGPIKQSGMLRISSFWLRRACTWRS